MKKELKQRCRAIVLVGEKIVSMYREFEGRKFYTFPGGGMEEGETETECVEREVMEEFGLVVKPIKKVYEYEGESSLEHFYVCEWISGEFGSGRGEEFQAGRNRGIYKPVYVDIADIPNLPLMPPEIASAFYEDYVKFGKDMTITDIKTFKKQN